MRPWCKNSAVFLALIFLQTFLCSGIGQVSAQPQTNSGTNIDLPTNGEVEKEIADKSEQGTQHLIKTLDVVDSRKIYYICALGNLTEDQRLALPMMHPVFEQLVNELAMRGGEAVAVEFKKVLLEEKLDQRDKALVKGAFQKVWSGDVSFTLLLTDKTQTREYLLRFDPAKAASVVVQKGDTLLPIACKAYPKLSKWSAVHALAFINGLSEPTVLYPKQVIKVYKYELIENSPADWTVSTVNTNN